MTLPNLYRLTGQTEERSHAGRGSAVNSGPSDRQPSADHPSNSVNTSRSIPGNRGNLGVIHSKSSLTTAGLIVIALGGFMLMSGLIMLIGGHGKQLLVGVGVAAVIGGLLLLVMGWTICLKINRKRHHQGGCVSYRTMGPCGGQVGIVGPPPAYSPLPIPSGLISPSPSSPAAVGSARSPMLVHTPLSSMNSNVEDSMFPYPPPSYEEAVQSG